MKKISVINEKGGVGKTTVSTSLASGLAYQSKRVLLVDLDAQGNSSHYFFDDYVKIDIDSFNRLEVTSPTNERKSLELIKDFIRKEIPETKDINTLLRGECEDIRECIYPTEIENLDIIPSLNTALIETDALLSVDRKKLTHNRLKKALKSIRHDYDYIIFDHAPTFNNITINGLVASDEILIPLKIGGSELRSFVNMLQEVFNFEDEFDITYDVRILFNMLPRGNRPQYTAFIEQMKKLFGHNILTTTIGYQDSVASKSSLKGVPLINTDSKVAADYKSLIQEIMKEEE